MTTLVKDQRKTTNRPDNRSEKKNFSQTEIFQKRGHTLNWLFNNSNDKESAIISQGNPNDTLDLIQMENIHVFPSYSYIFNRSEQRPVWEQIAISNRQENVENPF